MHKRRVVITGIGLATPLGKDVDEVWKNLMSDVNGISNLGDIYSELEQYGVYIAGLFPNIDLELMDMCACLGKKGNCKRFNKRDRVLLYCALKAVMNAKLQKSELDKMGVIIENSHERKNIIFDNESIFRYIDKTAEDFINNLKELGVIE